MNVLQNNQYRHTYVTSLRLKRHIKHKAEDSTTLVLGQHWQKTALYETYTCHFKAWQLEYKWTWDEAEGE